MDKKDILKHLKELAVLLEVKGANPFKIRALQNGARIIQRLELDIKEALSSGELANTKGIGKGILAILTELVETGRCSELDALKKELPAGLLEILKIPGLGAKKVKALYENLNITTLGELDYACRENRLVDLPGFGQKTQTTILDGIERLRQYARFHRLDEILPLANRLKKLLEEESYISNCAIVGDCGIYAEVIENIELLVATNSAGDRLKTLLEHSEFCHRIVEFDPRRIHFTTSTDLSVFIHICDDELFVVEKIKRTTHPELWERYLNKLAEKGLLLPGSVQEPDAMRSLNVETEADFFKLLDLPELPVEIRSSFHTYDFYLKRHAPALVRQDDIRGVVHAHSTWSDGTADIADIARYCKEQGYSYLAISDHSQSAFYANGLTPERIRKQHLEIDRLNAEATDFKILKSIEVDILPDGSLDYEDAVLAEFDLVIASIHSQLKMDASQATQRILKALSNPYVNILGHPTGRLLLGRDGYSPDMAQILSYLAEHGIAIEINANPRRLDLDWRWIPQSIELGVMLSINPDAHRPEGIDDIQYGVAMARKGGAESRHILNCRDVEGVLDFCRRG